MSMPSSIAAISHSFLASSALAAAISAVSPQVMQPGSSGKDATKPPSAVSGTISILYGILRYSSIFFIIIYLTFYHSFDHFDINDLYWFMLGDSYRITPCFSECDVTAAAMWRVHFIAIAFQYLAQLVKSHVRR